MQERALGTVTSVLEAVNAGEAGSRQRLLSIVYDELRRIARRRAGQVRVTGGEALRPTELIHEAYLRLFGRESIVWNDRQHFYGAAADAMLHILRDRQRRKLRLKHGAGKIDTLPVEIPGPETNLEVFLSLQGALDRLENKHETAARVVKYKYLLGMTETEIAQELSISRKTVHNKWRYAQAWLRRSLECRSGDR